MKPRMVEITDSTEYQYLLEHREDIGTPLIYIENTRMYAMSDSLHTWRSHFTSKGEQT